MVYSTTETLKKTKRVYKSVPVEKSGKFIPHADSHNVAIDMAEEIIKKAKTDADKTVQDATDQSDEILGKAQQDGYKKGFAKGHSEANAKYESIYSSLEKSLRETLNNMEGIRREMQDELRDTIISIALEIAVKTVKRELDLSPDIVSEIADETLAKVAPAKEVVLWLNPGDYEIHNDFKINLEASAGYPSKFKISPDESLSRGDVVVNYDRGTIDARLSTQLKNIVNSLLS